jgi:radical SAM superfamily enzyme YgiQ (UPF0313 family)
MKESARRKTKTGGAGRGSGPLHFRDAILSRETGAARKEWGGRLRVALVYPNRYAVAMANLGFLTIHARINARPGALCERAFLPDLRDARGIAAQAGGVRTLESGRPLSDFDIVAFSLSCETDLSNLPSILSSGGLPPFRSDRERSGERHPFVLGGGFAASLNPEMAGAIADAVVVGDGERAIEALLDLGSPPEDRDGFLRAVSAIPGLYVPAGYVPEHAPPGAGDPPGGGRLLALVPRPGFPGTVVREDVALADYPQPEVAWSPDSELGDMVLVETSRGCPGKCGFCAASHVCPRFREAPVENVRAAAMAAWPQRKKVGLIGAAVLDWSPFRDFAREILAMGGAVSPASVRADHVDEEIAEILRLGGHRTVALAPECGDEKRRGLIGKRMPDETFFSAARFLARAGILSFKLYFLVGLPGAPAEEEVGSTVAFMRAFKAAVLEEARSIGRMGTVTAVLSPFVPKPFTPLQWAPMAEERALSGRMSAIAKAVRPEGNLAVTSDTARSALLQGYLGLSDRRIESVLRRIRPNKGSLPAGELPVGPESLLFREKGVDEYFPWDVVEGGAPRSALRARYEAITRG